MTCDLIFCFKHDFNYKYINKSCAPEDSVNVSLKASYLNLYLLLVSFPQRFQEETDLDQFSTLSSSPEELLALTSELFARWLDHGCTPSMETCTLPTLPPYVERKDYGPSRARLLTTRAISSEDEEGQPDKMIDITQPPSNGGPPSLSYYASVWSPLLFRLYWWLLP